MSRSGRVTLAWSGGEHDFRLDLAQIGAVQEACDAGPAEILKRLSAGTWRMADLRAPILHGLIGGGLPPVEARALVARWVDQRPWLESVPVAHAVLMAALAGAPEGEADETPEPPPGEPPPASPCPGENSGSPASTPSGPPSG